LSEHVYFSLQSWGDHADIAQVLLVYIVMAGSVYIYCWLGNELSEQVRITRNLKCRFKFNTVSIVIEVI
jgi:hypothetical protein